MRISYTSSTSHIRMRCLLFKKIFCIVINDAELRISTLETRAKCARNSPFVSTSGCKFQISFCRVCKRARAPLYTYIGMYKMYKYFFGILLTFWLYDATYDISIEIYIWWPLNRAHFHFAQISFLQIHINFSYTYSLIVLLGINEQHIIFMFTQSHMNNLFEKYQGSLIWFWIADL